MINHKIYIIISFFNHFYGLDNFSGLGVPDGANKCPAKGGDTFKVWSILIILL